MPVVPTHPPTGAWLIGRGGCRGKAPEIKLRVGGKNLVINYRKK